MPTAIIADDEDLPRAELRRLLADAWPDLRIVAECADGAGALAAIGQHRPDVAFLDIRMPGLGGLEVAAAADGVTNVVFTTAYSAHAFEAFEAGALDYLLKPVTPARLRQCVERVRARAGVHDQDLGRRLADLERRLQPQAAPRMRWISASAGDTIKVIPVSSILFFQSEDKYTRVVATDGETHVRKSLKELLDALDPDEFWQIHRGVAVRADAIEHARRDLMGRITVQLRGRDEVFRASQTFAWRFRPM
jgi:DNA-binding LytR/AlgR family response regulator